jgi:hypothetical protein
LTGHPIKLKVSASTMAASIKKTLTTTLGSLPWASSSGSMGSETDSVVSSVAVGSD